MGTLFAKKALLPTGWASHVVFSFANGRITHVAENRAPDTADEVAACVIPGLNNAHSHAFQRALAGHTEQRSPDENDTFWTWRQRMYALAGRVDAESLFDIARQAYTEMLASGYTSVAEFHYLHRAPASTVADESMFEALKAAAGASGIRLVYIPVLYERAGFTAQQPEGPQALFATDIDGFLEHVDRARQAVGQGLVVGIGAHSLRAVQPASLTLLAEAAAQTSAVMHLHIAEQQREVDECLAAYGARPVEWLLDNSDMDERWCLVHATHVDEAELEGIAKAGAVVCLCPSTEANLGDGLFPLDTFLAADGRVAIGSDSHVSINPFEELRWLEYGQRLRTQSRNIASRRHVHVGRELFERAVEGGAQASGQASSGLVVGAPADFVCLYEDDPMLVGHDDSSRLDALVFSGLRLPIERVMVNGQWRVIDGEHVAGTDASAGFAAAVRRIGLAQ